MVTANNIITMLALLSIANSIKEGKKVIPMP
jgi:hypothetical protein